jgi:plasmid maintenance system antidote protein VapI
MTMKNPPHPGEIIRDLCIKPLGLTVTKAAEGLGITRSVNWFVGLFSQSRRRRAVNTA